MYFLNLEMTIQGIVQKKKEIIGNIIDRYDELFEKTSDEEYSYYEAIKMLGDFIDNTSDKKEYYKPSLYEVSLAVATALSILAIIANLVSSLVAVILFVLSISLYLVGGLYLYREAKFIESTKLDLDEYKDDLKKVFSYFKTCFTFWIIQLCIVIGRLIAFLFTLSFFKTNSVFFILVLCLLFIAVFILIIIIGRKILKRMKNQYTYLTGEKELHSPLKYMKNFLFFKEGQNK